MLIAFVQILWPHCLFPMLLSLLALIEQIRHYRYSKFLRSCHKLNYLYFCVHDNVVVNVTVRNAFYILNIHAATNS